MFIISIHYIVEIEKIEELLPEHLNWLKIGYNKGLFLASGRKNPRTGGVVFATGERSFITTYLQEDPFLKNNVAQYEIIEFFPTITHANLEILKDL